VIQIKKIVRVLKRERLAELLLQEQVWALSYLAYNSSARLKEEGSGVFLI